MDYLLPVITEQIIPLLVNLTLNIGKLILCEPPEPTLSLEILLHRLCLCLPANLEDTFLDLIERIHPSIHT